MKIVVLFSSIALFALAGCVGEDPVYSSLYGRDKPDAEIPVPVPASSSSSGETQDARPATSSSSSSGEVPDAGPSSSSSGSPSGSSSGGPVDAGSSSGEIPDAGPVVVAPPGTSDEILTTRDGLACPADRWRNSVGGPGCSFNENTVQPPYAWKDPSQKTSACSSTEIQAYAVNFAPNVVSETCRSCIESDWKGSTPESEYENYGPVVVTPNGNRIVNTGGCRVSSLGSALDWQKEPAYYEWQAEQCAVEVCDHLQSDAAFQACRVSAFQGSGSAKCEIVGRQTIHAVARFRETTGSDESCGKSVREEIDQFTTLRARFVAAATVMCGN